MTILNVIEKDIEGMRDFYTSLEEGDVGKRTFYVITNDHTHVEADILLASDPITGLTIPTPLQLFPGSLISMCTKLTPTRPWRDTKKWRVIADYKSILNQSEKERATTPDPTSRATIITGKSRTIMVPARRALRTGPYQNWPTSAPTFSFVSNANSAGDPLDPPLEIPLTEWELHCTKNVAVMPAWFANGSGYQNGVNVADQVVTINGATITIVAGTAKLGNFSFGMWQIENNVPFIPISWDVIFRTPRLPSAGEVAITPSNTPVPGPWDEERLDQGMRIRNSSTGWLLAPVGGIASPVPFNGSGAPITASGSPVTESSLWFYCYRPFGNRVDYSIIPWS